MSNELKHIIEKYNWNQEDASLWFDTRDTLSKQSSEYMVDFFPYLRQFEIPDIYAKKDNTVIFIEHFSFNSSKNISHGGSLQRFNEAANNSDFNNLIDTNDNNVVTSVYGIDNEADFASYKGNFCLLFERHLNRIPDYKENLKTKGIFKEDDILLKAFFIEDDSDWDVVYLNDSQYIVNLLYTNILWDFIKSNDVKNKLDYIFIGFDLHGIEPKVYFVDLKSNFDYVKNGIEIDENNFRSIGGIEWRGFFSIGRGKNDK